MLHALVTFRKGQHNKNYTENDAQRGHTEHNT